MTNGRRQKTKFKLNWINTVFVLGIGRYLQPLLFCDSNFFDWSINEKVNFFVPKMVPDPNLILTNLNMYYYWSNC